MLSSSINFQEDLQLQVMRRLLVDSELSQRLLAKELGVSLGSVNYCFKALVEKGWVKVQNFSQSKQKLRYAYILTPAGVAQKSKLTASFLKRKLVEYEALQQEIEKLQVEVNE